MQQWLERKKVVHRPEQENVKTSEETLTWFPTSPRPVPSRRHQRIKRSEQLVDRFSLLKRTASIGACGGEDMVDIAEDIGEDNSTRVEILDILVSTLYLVKY